MEDELELDADMAKFEAMANGSWDPKVEETLEQDPVVDAPIVDPEIDEEVYPDTEPIVDGGLNDEDPKLPVDGSEDPAPEVTDPVTEDTPVVADEIDYKGYYEAINNGEYSFNGKKVSAPDSPEKIIEAINTASIYSSNAEVEKQNAPYLAAMKESGLLGDPDKFRLALDLVKGDPEAIKKHLKDLDIDPMEMDLEEVKYEPKTVLKSQFSLDLEDTMNQAEVNGYGEKFNNLLSIISEDGPSLDRFSKNPQVRADLHKHMQNGTYDKIMSEMNNISAYDASFRGLPFINRYEAAWGRIPQENATPVVPHDVTTPSAPTPLMDEATMREQIRKELKEEQASASRKKASSVSRKRTATPPKTEVHPRDSDPVGYLNSLMRLRN